MGQYDWLLFDADGTIFDYDGAECAALTGVLAEAGVAMRPEILQSYREINCRLWHEVECGKLAPQVLKQRRFELLLARLNLSIPALHLSERYLDHLAGASQLIQGAEQLLRRCQSQFQLALLTNGLSRVQRPRLEHSAVGPLFSVVVISEEIGCAKPDKKYFWKAFEMMGQPPPERALMIGDNWNSDICGAHAFGLDTCWFNPAGLPRPAAPRIRWECSSLNQLCNILLTNG